MSESEILIVPTSSIYMFIGAAVQLLLILYCIGHSARSIEKWSLIRWLFVWMCYNIAVGVGTVSFATNGITVDSQHPQVAFFHQVWFSIFVWFGVAGFDFFLRFLKRKQPILMGILLFGTVVAFFSAWVYPDIADMGSNLSVFIILPITLFPLLYVLGLLIHQFFTTSDEIVKKRTGILMLSMFLGMFILIPLIILGIVVFKVIPPEYRHVFSFINSLQAAIFFTLAITKYGVLELGIEEAAEEMFSHMEDPVIILSEHGIISRVNPVAKSLFKIKENVQTKHITDLIPNFDATLHRFESRIEVNKQEHIYFCTLTEVRKEEIVVGNVLVLRDVTEEKRIVEMKNAFLSTVSHELRTPLTSILGFTKIIQKKWEQVILPKFSPENKREERAERLVSKNVGVIISEGERLTALINNVLDITKMESGTIDWKYEKTTMLEIMEQSISATQGLFANKEVTLKTNFKDAGIEVVADKDRLVQVLLNLISNAVKFTPEGTIEVGLTKREGNLLVFVKDSGVGMTKEASKKIFEKYHQVSEAAQKGTGLGLPISKEIIEGHGGEIWVESERGKGSTFFFTVPLPRSFIPTVRSANQKELLDQLKSLAANRQRIQQVLIVDDESSIRQLVSQSLEPGGYQLREAQNGLEALDFVRKHMPDLIISDVMMPKMNGFDLVAVLKNDVQFMHIPIIMLTVIPDEQRGYGLGVDTYLRKPISPDKIREEVDSLFSRLSAEKSVLIIGQSTKRIATLTKKISAMRYIVHCVESIQELIQIKGKKLTMVIVEEGFIRSSELQHALTSIGQSTVLIRIWKT